MLLESFLTPCNVPGEQVDPITKVLRYGAVADANAHQTFSVTKKVEGDLPEAAKDLDYTLEITLKNAADPTVNKTFEATIKAGETYTYPVPLPPGTEVTVSEGDLPEAAEITWNDAESRVFETADGVTLAADNREASFTLSDDHIFALTLTNTLVTTPTPPPLGDALHPGPDSFGGTVADAELGVDGYRCRWAGRVGGNRRDRGSVVRGSQASPSLSLARHAHN